METRQCEGSDEVCGAVNEAIVYELPGIQEYKKVGCFAPQSTFGQPTDIDLFDSCLSLGYDSRN